MFITSSVIHNEEGGEKHISRGEKSLFYFGIHLVLFVVLPKVDVSNG